MPTTVYEDYEVIEIRYDSNDNLHGSLQFYLENEAKDLHPDAEILDQGIREGNHYIAKIRVPNLLKRYYLEGSVRENNRVAYYSTKGSAITNATFGIRYFDSFDNACKVAKYLNDRNITYATKWKVKTEVIK